MNVKIIYCDSIAEEIKCLNELILMLNVKNLISCKIIDYEAVKSSFILYICRPFMLRGGMLNCLINLKKTNAYYSTVGS